MPYVLRNPDNSIKSLFGNPQTGVTEFLADDDVSVVTFLATLDASFKHNVIAADAFIQRFLDPEYALLLQKRATAVSAGNVGLIKMWDTGVARGSVDLSSPGAARLKAALVSNLILTQARADVVFA